VDGLLSATQRQACLGIVSMHIAGHHLCTPCCPLCQPHLPTLGHPPAWNNPACCSSACLQVCAALEEQLAAVLAILHAVNNPGSCAALSQSSGPPSTLGTQPQGPQPGQPVSAQAELLQAEDLAPPAAAMGESSGAAPACTEDAAAAAAGTTAPGSNRGARDITDGADADADADCVGPPGAAAMIAAQAGHAQAAAPAIDPPCSIHLIASGAGLVAGMLGSRQGEAYNREMTKYGGPAAHVESSLD
jgi:hypothetical protein